MAKVGPMGNLNVCWVTARRMRTCMLPIAEGPRKTYITYKICMSTIELLLSGKCERMAGAKEIAGLILSSDVLVA